MNSHRVAGAAVVVAVLCGIGASAARQPAPRFELVSIRALAADAGPTLLPSGWTPIQPGGHYVTPSTTLTALIIFAYDVRHYDVRLSGLPGWNLKRYAVAAKAPEGAVSAAPEENLERVRLMVRQMLADRFNLRLHTEVRPGTILKMSVAPGGRLKQVAAPGASEQEGRVGLAMGNTGGRLIGTKVTMAGLARAFGTLLRLDVLDETGLTGYYDFDFRWTAPPDPNGPPPGPGLGPEGQALFITAMRDEFGFRFSRESAPATYWIVDHVEPPTEN